MNKYMQIKKAMGVLILCIFISACSTGQTKTNENKKVVVEDNSYFVGKWKAEKIYGVDPSAQQLVEGQLSAYPDGLYMEFTKDGKACSMWDGATCTAYGQSYQTEGNLLLMKQEGLTGPEFRYMWKKTGEAKLELTAEFLMDNKWTTAIKYMLVKA